MSVTAGSFSSPIASASKKKHPLPSILLWALTAFAALSTAGILVFHGYIAWVLSHPNVAALSTNPLAADGLAYENVTFPSRDDGSTLSGWYIPAPGSKDTIVFSHGYGENREQIWVDLYDLIRKLNLNHYNLLLFDYGFVHDGQAVTGGVRERQELLGAIDYARSKASGRLFVWGFSMGAGTALQAALIDPTMDGMILDSTFLLDADTLYHNLVQEIQLPRFPSLSLVRLFFPLVGSVPLREIPFRQMETSAYSMPLFFIHSKKDSKAPYSLVASLFQKQSNPNSELWLVPDALHELIFRKYKTEYVDKTLRFLHSVDQGDDPHL